MRMFFFVFCGLSLLLFILVIFHLVLEHIYIYISHYLHKYFTDLAVPWNLGLPKVPAPEKAKLGSSQQSPGQVPLRFPVARVAFL